MKILKFYSQSCSPCKALASFLDSVEANVESVDVDEDMDTAIKYNVRGVPTMVKLLDGEEVDRIIGFDNSKQNKIMEWLSV